MMFGRTCGLNAAKVGMYPLGRYFRLYAAGVALRRQYGCISAPLPRCVGPVVSEPAGGGPKPGGRCGIQDNCVEGDPA